MKKNIIYLLLAFVAVIFASCNPLKDAINDIKPDPNTKTIALTITDTYSTVAAANTAIAVMLNKNYPQLPNKTKANVIYNSVAPVIKPADSLLKNIAYTVKDADYIAINGNANKNFTSAKVLQFLRTLYPTAVENQLSVLNYVYYEGGATTSAGVAVNDSFLYTAGAWNKIYQVSQAQYISVGKLSVFNFGSADEANLESYFNTFLKNDLLVAQQAKADDVKYISYAFYNSNAKENSQRIKALLFDGLNWVSKMPSAKPLAFLKLNGKWIPDPTIYYIMAAADYANLSIKDSVYNFGTPTNRANVAQYKSFNITATNGTQWTLADINLALIYTLKLKFPKAEVNPDLPYVITYNAYASSKYTLIPVKFFKTATGFVLVDPE